ncbi:LacI family DNA-binding transcriptional regulator [Cohnella cholangitidis]|uniref:LacI family transcriptional regulator n=1 Tax=Cohnella cholangitidis TaxID=2598458 RepID=A0A7G5C157_9BACL|nr:LacI family DNA-binding transcriptional regulator [Cohnella cholangitidis]QMV42941.1 LacI family transcriptional regulator [Cohnella cholangitidis]
MKKNEINSMEIAKLAGVSRSTVSRVINNYSNVPPETREKVLRIIEQYHYVPNASAQVLAGKKTRTIGLFMIEAGHVSSDVLTNMLIASVIENASFHGYYVLTRIIRDAKDVESVRGVKDIFYQRRIDGGLFIGAANDEPFIEQLIAEGYSVAIVDQEKPGSDEPNRIVANFDNESGMMQAVEFLSGLNHRQIGLISGDMRRFSGPSKLEGFRKAMERYGIPIEGKWIMPGGFSEQSGYDAIREFMRTEVPLPTAMIMANDSVAFGAIRALREAGVRVPEDVSIIGFDDHAFSSRFQPALTTLRVDFGEMMQRLTTSLIDHIEQRSSEFIKFAADMRLIVRDSCMKL